VVEIPLAAGTAPIVVRCLCICQVVGVLGLHVVEAGGLVEVGSLGVQRSSVLVATVVYMPGCFKECERHCANSKKMCGTVTPVLRTVSVCVALFYLYQRKQNPILLPSLLPSLCRFLPLPNGAHQIARSSNGVQYGVQYPLVLIGGGPPKK
jgi:hypothetical protein